MGYSFLPQSTIADAQNVLPPDYFDNLYKFAFVRNPWDLQVSWFHQFKREKPEFMEDYDSFKDFMKWKLNPKRNAQPLIDSSLQLQTDFLVDGEGRLRVDRVGKYENIQNDFDGICEHLGLKKVVLPYKRKETNRKNYRDYYSDELAAQVGAYFKRDIEMLGYEF